MAVAIKLPDMGTNVEECKLQAWRVQEGQRVKRGDVLADIETDKAVAELESTAEGVLLRQVVKAGVMAQMGDVLAYVGQPGESVPDPAAATSAASGAAAPAPVASRLRKPQSRPARPRGFHPWFAIWRRRWVLILPPFTGPAREA